MGESIVYQFVAVGADDVNAAFAGHAAAAERAAKAAEGSYARTARAASDAGRTQKNEAEKAATAAAAATEKAEQRRWKEVEKTAAKIQKEFDKEAKAAEKASTTKVKAEQKAASEAAKIRAKDVRDAEKAAAFKAKVDAKWTDNRIKTEERWAKEVARAQERATKKAEQETKRRARAAEQAAKRKATAEKTAATAAFRVRQELAHRGATMVLGLAAAGAASFTALIGKAVTDSIGTQSLANRISINGRSPGGESVNPAIIRRELEATAIAHAGQTAEGIAGGVSAFQENRGGDRANALTEARKYQDVIATVSSATGKGADEIGKAAAILAREGEANNVDEMGAALARLVEQARKTGEPLDEAVQHLDKLGAAAKRFGLTGPQGAAQLGALQTIAAEGVGAGQADKAVEQFFKRITTDKTARQLKGAGIDPYADKNGHLKSPREILEGLYAHVGTSASASDKISTISKLAGGPRGAQMLAPLNAAFAKGYEGATGTNQEKVKAGVDAMLAAFDRAGTEVGSYADLQGAAKQAESDSAAQLTASYEKIKAIVGAELAPELAKLATELAKDPGAIAEFTQGIRAAADVLAIFARIASLMAKYDVLGLGQQAKTNGALLDLLEGKNPSDSFFGAPAPGAGTAAGAAINPATGLPAYATDPAATGRAEPFRMPGAIDPSAMPPAVGAPLPVPGAGGAVAAPAVAPGGAGAAESGAAFKGLIEEAGRTFVNLVAGAVTGAGGDVFGGRHSVVDPS